MTFLRAFFRQCVYALAFFTAMALAAEFLIPGVVTPFVDPLPLSIITLGALAADAMRRSIEPNAWVRWLCGGVLSVGLIAMAMLSVSSGGRSGTAASVLIAIMVGLAIGSVFPVRERS